MTQFNLNNYSLWTALITPFTETNQIDFDSLEQLVANQQASGNGILLLGSTGEGLSLDTAEQKSIVDFVISLKPSVPLMVAVGGFNLSQQLQWIEYCNQLNISAYLLASPLYSKPGIKGQLFWFRELLSASNHPCMIYNVPSRSGIDLDPDVLRELSQEENFWAIKEASGSLQRFHEYKHACPEIKLFSGDDGLFPEHSADDAAGLVSVVSNAWPEATRLFVEYHLSDQTRTLSAEWKSAVESMFNVTNPIPVKILMHHLNQIQTPYLRYPLTHLELNNTEQLVICDQLITRWRKQL